MCRDVAGKATTQILRPPNFPDVVLQHDLMRLIAGIVAAFAIYAGNLCSLSVMLPALWPGQTGVVPAA